MKILIAEDDYFTRRMLESLLSKWGFDVISTDDGDQAWKILEQPDAPMLAILDWMMPKMEGAEICRKFRQLPHSEITYIIMLTSKGSKNDIVEGLKAGANDYITKPFDHDELHARIQVGKKMVQLQKSLEKRVRELQEAIEHIKLLQGILPICSYCKKIRNDENYWQQLESYFSTHSDLQFSHGICPDCYEKYVKIELDKLKNNPISSASKPLEEDPEKSD